ncbi:theronine dehydrogenase [Actinomadura sp. KC06]|uniref:alcohol dehydrogenase catalytic domain-containing protein n=1 Tax=Actinomadura sp. KC06 TaxID=2530369 RepID=UPI001044187B|nr:alcohol dehydrogenase catalytic domain-containing protein [Actinomadura sp. KC06]TDD40155.1 theronine dehydrogenase [Actinomadura sp. KC06]
MTSMLAARALPGSAELHLTKTAVPEPGPQDVLVKVASAGLAPGMMTLLGRGAFKHLPTTLGHEAAGTVAALGADAAGVAVGDRVRIHPNLTCRDCVYCRTDREMMCAQQAMIGHAAFGDVPMPLYDAYHDGGLAEFVRVPHWLLDPLPGNVSFDVGAKVHDLANAVRALKCADLPLGGTLVVTAATGTMGTATVKLAPHFGVARLVLVGRSAERLADVRRLAGDLPTETVALDELPDDWATTQGLTRRLRELAPEGAHAVLDFVPDGPVMAQATAAMATGGTMVHMGANPGPLPIPARVLMVNCWRVVGTRSCTRTDAREVLALLGRGVLAADELITHRFPLAEAGRAVAAMQSRSEPIWMAVINP